MTATPAVSFERRVANGDSLRGLLVRLPVGDRILAALNGRFSFVVVDLVNGPYSEVDIAGLVDLARGQGLAVIASVDASSGPPVVGRLRRLGVEGVVRDGSVHVTIGGRETVRALQVVHSLGQLRRLLANGAPLVAVDMDAAWAAMLVSFAEEAVSPPEREALVMLPGMLGDARVFDGVAEALSALDRHAACRPQRIDLDDTIAGIADSVLVMSPQRFAVVGHSLGAIVALEVYRRAPLRVTRLALLNASPRAASAAQLAAWTTLEERTERGDFSTIVVEQAAINVGQEGEQRLIDLWADMARRVGPQGFIRQLNAQASRPDSRPVLGDIDVPVLVLSGSADDVCPVELQAELACGISAGGGTVIHETIEGAGHMSPLDHPAEVAAHLNTWLRPRTTE